MADHGRGRAGAVCLMVLAGLLAGCSLPLEAGKHVAIGSPTPALTTQVRATEAAPTPTGTETATPAASLQPPTPPAALTVTPPSPPAALTVTPPSPTLPPADGRTLAATAPAVGAPAVPHSSPIPTRSAAPLAASAPPGEARATATAGTASGHVFHYVFPVAPPSMGRYGTCHHDYPASDIFVPIGTPFVAVIDGVVDFVSYQDTWSPAANTGASRGGLSVAVVGADGVRYYGSHLSQIASGIAPGVRVRAGQILGYSGHSGDARVTAPHVHFGISHPTRPDDWATRRGEINPYRYLNAWRSGIDRTPNLSQAGGGVCDR